MLIRLSYLSSNIALGTTNQMPATQSKAKYPNLFYFWKASFINKNKQKTYAWVKRGKPGTQYYQLTLYGVFINLSKGNKGRGRNGFFWKATKRGRNDDSDHSRNRDYTSLIWEYIAFVPFLDRHEMRT